MPGDRAAWAVLARWSAGRGRRDSGAMVRRGGGLVGSAPGAWGSGACPARRETPGREAWSSGVPELRAWRSRGVLAGRAQGAADPGPRTPDPGPRTPHAPGAERPGLSRILCSQGWVVREHPPPPPPRSRAWCARRPEQRTWVEGLSYLEWKAH